MYVSLNNESKIVIPSNIFISLLEFRQLGSESEAGGIFVGKRLLNNSILIINFSRPQDNDVRSRYKFSKWHTHPENIPTASIVDIQSWERIISDNDDRLFFLIIGLQAGRFYFRESNEWQSTLIYFKDVLNTYEFKK